MKKVGEAIGGVLLFILIIGIFGGFIFLAFSQQARFAEESKQECAKVSKISNAQDYFYDNSTCYLIRNNKFESVQL